MEIYRRIAKLIKPHWVMLAFAIVCMLAVAGSTAALA